MIRILFLFFVLIPLLELYVLIEVGSGIGGLTTIALCLLTAAVGGMIIRVQGLQTLLQAKKSMQQHELAEHGLHGV
ncbi:MAG: FxsA family protein, partial [Ghiorsea sp.]|nr:FxsA family protein [Ghiorsea sp.]